MRIAVNLRQYFKGKIGGMENYLRNVLSGLSHHRLTVWVHEDEVAHTREFLPGAEIIGIRHETGLDTIRAGLKTGQFDLFFCPLLVLEPLVVDLPSAAMMPDVQHEFFPEFFDNQVLQWRRQNYGPTALNADVLFTLSEHAKATIVERFRIDPAKVRVIHLDADEEFRQPLPETPTEAFRALELPGNYIYFPANFWPHKNHSNILLAMQLLVLGSQPELHLVLSGSPATGADRVREEARKLGIEKYVHLCGYVEKRLVPEVYGNSRALLFATKFEGFGIPLLEAFHMGVPAITSNSGSCVEVAGTAAELVNPLDPRSIAEGVQRVLTDPALRERRIAEGRERLRLFSWQRAVELTEKAFEQIAAPGYRKPSPVHVETKPVVGIVTPTYNMAQFLEETIESVLSQDYPHIEYVVMDAGSKDGSVEILRKYEDRLRWCSEKDRGQADAINKGYHALGGDLFAYLNSDDTYLPEAVGKMAAHFMRNPGVGLIYGEAYHVQLDGTIIDRYPTQPFDFQSLNNQCYICQPAAFMLREAVRNAGMMNVEMHFALDYELWIRIAKQYGVLKVDDYIATSRMHMDNKTLSKRRQVYQEIIGTVKLQYGYAPYEWINGYASYLLDGKDQYFDRSKPSLAGYALSLLLGGYHNPHQLRRYWAEWARMTGFGGKFTGRWEDGWISQHYVAEHQVAAEASVLHIEGKHWAPVRGPLQLTVKVDGREVHRQALREAGPFTLEMNLPNDVPGRQCRLSIESDKTWRPKQNGDYRALSCVIDSIRFEPARIAT